jgi:hypothetical protein
MIILSRQARDKLQEKVRQMVFFAGRDSSRQIFHRRRRCEKTIFWSTGRFVLGWQQIIYQDRLGTSSLEIGNVAVVFLAGGFELVEAPGVAVESAAHKMSKSKGNVVDPNTVRNTSSQQQSAASSRAASSQQ